MFKIFTFIPRAIYVSNISNDRLIDSIVFSYFQLIYCPVQIPRPVQRLCTDSQRARAICTDTV